MADLDLFGGAGFGDALLGAVVIDGDEAYFDDGALHGRSRAESGVQFLGSREQLEGGAARRIVLVWVAVKEREPSRYGYVGLSDSEMWIDQGRSVGYKNLVDQANRMGDAVRGVVGLGRTTARERQRLLRCLMERLELWRYASTAVKEALPSEVAA